MSKDASQKMACLVNKPPRRAFLPDLLSTVVSYLQRHTMLTLGSPLREGW